MAHVPAGQSRGCYHMVRAGAGFRCEWDLDDAVGFLCLLVDLIQSETAPKPLVILFERQWALAFKCAILLRDFFSLILKRILIPCFEKQTISV